MPISLSNSLSEEDKTVIGKMLHVDPGCLSPFCEGGGGGGSAGIRVTATWRLVLCPFSVFLLLHLFYAMSFEN